MHDLIQIACAAPQNPGAGLGTWAGRPIGTPPAPNPIIKRSIISRAIRKGEVFGRQTVVMKGSEGL